MIIRLVLFVLLFAAGGAIVNVAVAWGPQLTVAWNHSLEQRMTSEEAQEFWSAYALPTWTSKGVLSGARESWFDYSLDHAEKWLEHSSDSHRVYLVKEGWPCRAVQAIFYSGEGQTFIHRGGLVYTFHQDNSHQESWVKLAYLPIWPGFAINTVFYAAVLWGLFACPGALRRFVRRRRGRCTRCGYDLRGQVASSSTPASILCPECGQSA